MSENILTLCAAGSDRLIAEEIAAALRGLFSSLPEIAIETHTVDELDELPAGALAVCAASQYERLRVRCSPEQIFVLDLVPTTHFFLDLAKIPSTATVYVFNNHFTYADTLIDYCRTLQLRQDFRAIAFDEQPEQIVGDSLKDARYIIGVEPFVGEGSPLYRRFEQQISPEATVISARRIIAVRSEADLLRKIDAVVNNLAAASATGLQSSRWQDFYKARLDNMAVEQLKGYQN